MAPPRTMHWFRWYHNSANDIKWKRIGAHADTSVANVIGVWIMVLESASENFERGVIGSWDTDDIAYTLGITPEDVARILNAMQGKVLTGQRVTNWSKRQPKREKTDGSISEHIGAYQDISDVNEHMGPRGEERRGEERRREEKQLPCAPASHGEPEVWVAKCRAVYPKRSGSNSWVAAAKAIRARLKDGFQGEVLLAGTERYLAYCVDRDIIGRELVMQAVRFYGPREEFLNDWELPAPPPDDVDDMIAAVMADRFGAHPYLRGDEYAQ